MGKIIDKVDELYEQGISVSLTKTSLGYCATIGDAWGESLDSKFDDVSDCYRLSRVHVKKGFNPDSVKETGKFYSNKSLQKALDHAVKWLESNK